MDILTFRNWREDFVSIHFDLNDSVTIKSGFNGGILMSSSKKSFVDEMKTSPNNKLLKIYKEHFEHIQYHYKQLLKEYDNHAVQNN